MGRVVTPESVDIKGTMQKAMASHRPTQQCKGNNQELERETVKLT